MTTTETTPVHLPTSGWGQHEAGWADVPAYTPIVHFHEGEPTIRIGGSHRMSSACGQYGFVLTCSIADLVTCLKCRAALDKA